MYIYIITMFSILTVSVESDDSTAGCKSQSGLDCACDMFACSCKDRAPATKPPTNGENAIISEVYVYV